MLRTVFGTTIFLQEKGKVSRSEHKGFVRAHRIFWLALVLVGAALLAGCSSSGTVIGQTAAATHPPLPTGWKPVSYQGIEIYVPDSWPVEELAAYPCGGGPGPMVLVGPSSQTQEVINCPAFNPQGTIVSLGDSEIVDESSGHETEQSINEVSVFVSSSSAVNNGSAYMYVLQVRIPDYSAQLNIVSLGATAAAASSEAQQIMSTIHASEA